MLIYNSQSRRKEEFQPLDPDGKSVCMYVCGVTVYASVHLGHARAAITPDIARRYLEYKGYRVRLVMNFTDIDDKIIKRAQAEKRDWRELTLVYIQEFKALMQSLNVLPATAYPKATETIPEMIEIVHRLLSGGHAYVAADGDIYFNTASFPRYGNLSGRKAEEESAGQSHRLSDARLSVKKNPGDFVLWKCAKPGEPAWETPYGWAKGRPGWHLECSAMSHKFLGVPIDIHGGGQDLLFPHHEDEKAQTECAYGDELHGREAVRYWMHNGLVSLADEKMSKSLGNAKWLREMIWPEGPYDPMTVRMMFLSLHYRAPLNFEGGLFDEAKARLDRVYNALEAIPRACEGAQGGVADAPAILALAQAAQQTEARFKQEMEDDFNTAGALGALFELIAQANKALAQAGRPLSARAAESLMSVHGTLVKTLEILGLRTQRGGKPGAGDTDTAGKLVELLAQVRQEVRAAKLYALGDQIRKGLKDLGYEVEDLPGGKWIVKRRL